MSHWDEALAPEKAWKDAYGAVATHVVRMLQPGANPRRFSTAELVEHCCPASLHKPATVSRFYKALAALAKHDLKDYCEAGPARASKFNSKKTVRPLVWRQPPPKAEASPSVSREAIRAEAFEEAAKIADRETGYMASNEWDAAAFKIAAAIRALSAPEHGERTI